MTHEQKKLKSAREEAEKNVSIKLKKEVDLSNKLQSQAYWLLNEATDMELLQVCWLYCSLNFSCCSVVDAHVQVAYMAGIVSVIDQIGLPKWTKCYGYFCIPIGSVYMIIKLSYFSLLIYLMKTHPQM